MKFKMAPNSLFAILLRSPWWVSWAIAGAIALLCGALLPGHLAPYAAVGVLPIVIVGGMSAWRQLKAPSPAKVQAALAQAAAMSWRDFAAALEAAWQADGQTVQQLTQSQADLRLDKAGQSVLVSAKRWKAATHGVEPLRELQSAVQIQGAQAGIYIAMQGKVSDNARSYEHERWFAAVRRPYDDPEALRRLRGILGFDSGTVLPLVRCPVLVLLGAADPTIDLHASIAAYGQRLLPNARSGGAVLPDADQGMFIAAPTDGVDRRSQLAPAYLPLVASFLAAQRP